MPFGVTPLILWVSVVFFASNLLLLARLFCRHACWASLSDRSSPPLVPLGAVLGQVRYPLRLIQCLVNTAGAARPLLLPPPLSSSPTTPGRRPCASVCWIHGIAARARLFSPPDTTPSACPACHSQTAPSPRGTSSLSCSLPPSASCPDPPFPLRSFPCPVPLPSFPFVVTHHQFHPALHALPPSGRG